MGRAYCVCDVRDYCSGIYFWAMKNWIINKWDWWIYFRALSTLRRMSKKSIGFTYLLELHLRKYNKPIEDNPQLKYSTESFYESLESYNED